MKDSAKIFVGVAICWWTFLSIHLALHKPFSSDEAVYAHSAWLISKGQVPYRDFFDHHFPFICQLLSLFFRVLGDDPRHIVALRLGMLPFLALGGIAAACINRPKGTAAAMLAPVFLFSIPAYMSLSVEIRPDPAAFALFLASLALWLDEGPRPPWRLGASGAFLALAVWTSQKALVYGSVLMMVFALDLATWFRHRTDRSKQENPWWFLGGTAVVLGGIGLYLTLTHSWVDAWRWCVLWNVMLQRMYPPILWHRFFDPIFKNNYELFGLGALGLASAIRRTPGVPGNRRDLLLVGTLVSAFLSFRLQRAPLSYSLLPFLGLFAIFAARGVADICQEPVRISLRVGVAVLAGVFLVRQNARLVGVARQSNGLQLAKLARIEELTTPTDTAYDNIGGYITRPHAYFFFFTDQLIRHTMADKLIREVPAALIAHDCVMRVQDPRSRDLPRPILDFLEANYQPFDGDLAFWGHRYEGTGKARENRFLAVRTGKYFVTPVSLVQHRSLMIDGQVMTQPIFVLSKGIHSVRYGGLWHTFYILWLPRNGQMWTPRPGLKPTYLQLMKASPQGQAL